MKTEFLRTIALISMLCIFFSCNGNKNTKADEKVLGWVSNTNTELVKYPVAGFAYKNARLPRDSWKQWGKTAAPAVKEILKQLPEGYVLQVTGHADASGPEEPVQDKPGNLKISTDRAKAVFDALRKAGITSPKLTYKGSGAARLIEGVDPRSPKQRRVTFEVVPK